MRHVLGNPAILTMLLVQLGYWSVTLWRTPINPLIPGLYFVSVLVGAGLWTLLSLACDELRPLLRGVLSVIVGLFLALMSAANVAIFLEFGELVSADMLQFLAHSGQRWWIGLGDYVITYLPFPTNILFTLVVLFWAAVWFYGRPLPIRSLSRRKVAATAAVALVGALAISIMMAPRNRLAPEASTFAAILRAPFIRDASHERGDTKRRAVISLPRGLHPPNVVLVINESWSRSYSSFYGGKQTMPFLTRWFRRERQLFHVFERAYANTTSTQLSIPTLMTGLPPSASVDRFYRAPLVWDWATAAHVEPMLLAAKPFISHRLDDFIALEELDIYRAGKRTPTTPKLKEHIGELHAASRFPELLRQVDTDRPFLLVYSPVAGHEPYQVDSPLLNRTLQGSRYERAQGLVDAGIERIVDSLRAAGRLENTLFIFTSDHGSALDRRHILPRAYSLYEEFTRIPLIIRVPRRWQGTSAGRNLRRNTQLLVSHLDVLPTIVEALGFYVTLEHTPLLEWLAGRPLTAELPPGRTIITLNNNGMRHWEHRSFGIFWLDWRFIYSTIEGPQLFDLTRDPMQRRDLWPIAPPSIRSKVLSTMAREPALQNAWKN